MIDQQPAILDQHYFGRYGFGKTLLLVGTSTSGKSSLVHHLRQQLPHVHEDGIDLRLAAGQEVSQTSVLAEVFAKSMQGRTAIVDATDTCALQQVMRWSPFKGPLFCVLLYCSQTILCKRLTERNSEARCQQQLRLGTFPLEQYSTLFGPAPFNGVPLETINQLEMQKRLSHLYDEKIRHKAPSRSPSEQAIRKERHIRDVLSRIGFTSQRPTITVSPRQPHLYYLVLNSGEQTPEALAQKLIHLF